MDKYLEEYSSEEAIRKYTRDTAGFGISYILEKEYGKIYLETIEKSIPTDIRRTGLRLLEFGCGGGMNLIYIISSLERHGIYIESAIGTDFSETLINAARKEAKSYLSSEQLKKVTFCVARNESIVQDLTDKLDTPHPSLLNSFHLVIGVNTFRYCHRLNKEMDCAMNIFDLLTKGGVCIIIDMNNKFPFFRSRISDWLTMDKKEYYLPSLDEYVRPFLDVGFEVNRKENFCWIPHSAGPGLTRLFHAITPFLNMIARKYAMRSLVISKKTN